MRNPSDQANKSRETRAGGPLNLGGLGRFDVPAPDDEIAHLQADGFWGDEKGFDDAEEFRRQLQQQQN